MRPETYKKVRAVTALFVGLTVSTAVTQNSFMLAAAAVITGMLFLAAARSRTKITIDERETYIRERAAQTAYAIFTPVIGLGSVIITFFGRKQETAYLYSLGMVLSYLTLFLIATYSIAYYFINKRYGGGGSEE